MSGFVTGSGGAAGGDIGIQRLTALQPASVVHSTDSICMGASLYVPSGAVAGMRAVLAGYRQSILMFVAVFLRNGELITLKGMLLAQLAACGCSVESKKACLQHPHARKSVATCTQGDNTHTQSPKPAAAAPKQASRCDSGGTQFASQCAHARSSAMHLRKRPCIPKQGVSTSSMAAGPWPSVRDFRIGLRGAAMAQQCRSYQNPACMKSEPSLQ